MNPHHHTEDCTSLDRQCGGTEMSQLPRSVRFKLKPKQSAQDSWWFHSHRSHGGHTLCLVQTGIRTPAHHAQCNYTDPGPSGPHLEIRCCLVHFTSLRSFWSLYLYPCFPFCYIFLTGGTDRLVHERNGRMRGNCTKADLPILFDTYGSRILLDSNIHA